MEQSRRTATIGLAVVAAAMIAVSLTGRGLGDLFSSGSSGEDQKKLDTIERLRAALHEGATEDEAKALLSREGVDYQMDGEANRIVGAIHRVRWDAVTYESVLIAVGMENGRVAKVEFKSVYTGP
jgi:hypothetical protein